jgi:hypothetical protein
MKQVPSVSMAGGLQDHKDSLNRYTRVSDRNRGNDHYLQPEDGKLGLLRVQRAPGYSRHAGLRTTWMDPEEPGPFKLFWTWLQDTPRNVVTWTYDDWLKSKSQENGAAGASSGNGGYGEICSRGWILSLSPGNIADDTRHILEVSNRVPCSYSNCKYLVSHMLTVTGFKLPGNL